MVLMSYYYIVFLMIRLLPRCTRPDTLVPYTTLFRSRRRCVRRARRLRLYVRQRLRRRQPGGPVRAAQDHDLRRASEPAGEVRGGRVSLLKLVRSEEHTSELQSLMRISYAVFCLKKKKTISHTY